MFSGKWYYSDGIFQIVYFRARFCMLSNPICVVVSNIFYFHLYLVTNIFQMG